MRKNSYIFTAILAIVVSTGAWADAPKNDDEREAGTVHDVYKPTNLAESGIAGVTYVNRVGEMAGAAAAAAESHAADASKSAYAAQSSANAAAGAASNADAKAGAAATAAANAQASADAAAAAANSITNGDGITIETSEDNKKEITVKPKDNAGISVDSGGVAVKAGKGIDVSDGNVNVTPGGGIKIDNDTVAVNAGHGLKIENSVLKTNLDTTTNHALSGVKAGTAITVTSTKSGNDITAITVSANTPAANTAGVVQMPTYTEMQRIINPNATPQEAPLGEGELDRKYGLSVETYMNAEAQYQLELSAALNEKVSLPTDTNDSPIKNVGTNARPVYVNNGTAAAVESITIPVGSENFANTITSANVAKIWIQ